MITVILVNYNGKKEILSCLVSLRRSNLEKETLQIIVVDNDSSDGSVTAIKKKFPDMDLIVNSSNLGFAGGNNMGIRKALADGADYLMLLNSDTLVEKSCLQNLAAFLDKNEVVGIAVPKIYFAPGFEFHKNRYKKKDQGKVVWYAGGQIDWQNILGIHKGVNEIDRGQFKEIKEVRFATGCCLMARRSVFEKIGFFDERFFLYLEDLDFSVRVKKAGFKIFFVPQAVIWHKNLGTTGKESQLRQAYYYSRNRLLFGLKHAPLKTKLSLLKWSLKIFLKGNRWERKGILDFYLGKLGKGSWHE